jgi:hypothetical protein
MTKRPLTNEETARFIGALQALAAILFEAVVIVFQFSPDKGIYWVFEGDGSADPKRIEVFNNLILQRNKDTHPDMRATTF